jgi:hypothetical protein
MNNVIENERLKERAIELFSKSKNAQMETMSKDIIVSSSHKYATLLGLKITRVKFQNKEYLLKANRYLLLFILKYLIENNKIDLKRELPLKTSASNIRSLFNTKPFHSDDYPMSDILHLKSDNERFYIGAKLDTNAIHYAAFYLLRRYKIPIENFEVHYVKRKNVVEPKYAKILKKQGYCLVDDSGISSDWEATEINNKLLTNKN